VFTTVGDLLRWFTALERGQVAGGALKQAAYRQGTLTNGDSIGYSIGLEIGTLRGRRYLRHGGNDLGANAYEMHLIDDSVSVAVLCNGRELDAFTLARQALEPFLPGPQAAATPVSSATVPPPPAARLRSFAGLYYNPATLALRVVELRADTLYWVRGASATPLDPVSASRFQFRGQPAELLFLPARAGATREMQVISGGTTVTYQQAEPFVPPPGGLETYAGAYSSDELNVTLLLRAKEGTLEISNGGSWRFDLQPVFRDAFALPEAVVVQFVRDRSGRVTGFVADMSRSRGIRFRKVQGS
jgi:hypothetical protein